MYLLRTAFIWTIFPLFVISAKAQNEVSAPTPQTIRLNSDNVIVKQKVSINSDSGYVSLSSYKFLGIKKNTASQANSLLGPGSGNNTMSGRWNTFIGENSGNLNSTGYENLFAGSSTGTVNTTGYGNLILGVGAGLSNQSGNMNIVFGNTAGGSNVSGSSNVFLGWGAGNKNTGSSNVYIGRAANFYTAAGTENVSLGFGAGSGSGTEITNGTGNVFIGQRAGYFEGGNNKLYIANSNTTTPLIYGEFPTTNPLYGGKLVFNTRVGVGEMVLPNSVMVGTVSTDVSSFKMFINGGLVMKESIVTLNGSWADYVFDQKYKLTSLIEVESFISHNHRLPNIPSAAHIEKGGINVGEMARLQQEKIEELTLYIIEQNKRLSMQRDTISEYNDRIEKLSKQL